MNLEVERLLDLAASLPPERRTAFLVKECPDARVRAEVASLLAYATGAEAFFDEAIHHAADDVRSSREPAPGDLLGAYRILSLLGRGGMGAVYLAERADGELQQKVAIKLLRGDCFRPVWRERFLTERQLLASLQHPSIIHVIDAGHTPEGRPYLIMEYVDGQPIDTFVDALDMRRRLELFLRVCEGVAHAHRRLIIHRDLKPSNILVDASGQPKLLDFGIAKLLDDTGSTQTVERLLTPDYASPEQLAGAPQSTATDIYSLGIILHQLLTGRVPRRPTPGKASEKPVRPSDINPQIPRDVDYLIAKALRPEPEDRYLSVGDLASDVRAVLARRPVQARAGDRGYRARRFLRRYWLPLAASFAVVASLSAGLYIANRERQIAERRFGAVRQLANKLFDIDAQVAQLPGSSKTRQLIVDTALEYLQRMSVDAPADAGLALDLGGAYMRVGRVLGVNISPNLGQTEQADTAAAHAQNLIESVLATDPRNRTALLRAAQVAHDRMILAGDRHNDGQALEFARRSVARLDQYFATGELTAQSDRKEAQQVILALINIANRYMIAGDNDRAIRLCGRAGAIARVTNWPTQAASSLIIVAQAQRARGDLNAALNAIQESVRMLEPKEEKAAGRNASYTLAMLREAQILGEPDTINLGRTREAVAVMERVIAISDDYARRDPSDFSSQHRVFNAKVKLAGMVAATEPQRALDLLDDGLRILVRTASHGGNTQNEIRTLAQSVGPLLRLNRGEDARQRLDTAFARLAQLKLYPAERVSLGSEADQTLRAQAEYEAAAGDPAHALAIYRDLLQAVLSGATGTSSLTEAVQLANLYRDFARVQRLAHRPDQAAQLDARRRELWQQWDRKLPGNAFIHRLAL
ncbi:MAG: serine/threonine-protein kinase [Candidatus Solibacter sp.]